jgi:hypothetical protein
MFDPVVLNRHVVPYIYLTSEAFFLAFLSLTAFHPIVSCIGSSGNIRLLFDYQIQSGLSKGKEGTKRLNSIATLGRA